MREIDNRIKVRFASHLFISLLALATLKMATPVRNTETLNSQNTQSVLVAPEKYSPRSLEGYLIKPPLPKTITATPTPNPTPVVRRLSSIAPEKPAEKSLESLRDNDLIIYLEMQFNKKEFSVEDTFEAIKQATPQVACTIFHETGRDTKYSKAYDPYTLDGPDLKRAYNIGLAQFAKENGKLPEFFSLGHTDPFNPYQVVPYMNDAFARDQQWAWGPVVSGLC